MRDSQEESARTAGRASNQAIVPAGSMSLEEARAVMWLRNMHRPRGELLDEGYLSKGRLEWAARKAYDPKLRQAAAVLLASLEKAPAEPVVDAQPATAAVAPFSPIDLPVSVEQARATLWPIGPLKGQPMGPLADAKQLTLKDLGYAIENAWEVRVRQAAAVLMAVQLNQAVKEPPPSAGFVEVVSGGRSYAERRQYQLAVVQGMVSGAVLSLLGCLAVLSVVRGLSSRPDRSLSEILVSPAGVVALVVALALGAVLVVLVPRVLDWLITRLDRQIENYRKGQEGETRVVDVIRQTLDGNWTILRNVTLPGRSKGDLDAVLVGPPGVWVLEVKALSGEYRNIGEHWEYRAGKRRGLLRSSPSRQAQSNAARLAGFLRADGISQWVTPVVVWANPESLLAVENPSVAVWTLDRLPDELGNAWQGSTIPEPERLRIVDKLTRLCQRERPA